MNPPQTEQKANGALVIIPAYNEEGIIEKVINRVRQARLGDILVVNDGSRDHTAKAATEAGALVANLPFNLGIGGAVQTGLRLADEMGYSYIVRLDGDGQHNVEEATTLLNLVMSQKADIAFGSRFLPGHVTFKSTLARRIGILWFSLLLTLITRQRVTDPTSGMFAANRRAVRFLAENYPQDYPEVEARVLIHKAGLHVTESPVTMAPRKTGKSSINLMRSVYYVIKVTLATLMVTLRRFPENNRWR